MHLLSSKPASDFFDMVLVLDLPSPNCKVGQNHLLLFYVCILIVRNLLLHIASECQSLTLTLLPSQGRNCMCSEVAPVSTAT